MIARIIVGIPTAGRSAILCETLRELRTQTRQPDGIFVCGRNAADLEGVGAVAPGSIQLLSEPGASRQRNTIIDAATTADIIVFFDDDFLAHSDYLAEIDACMTAHPEIVVATGFVIADGIKGPGFSPEEGRLLLKRVSSTGTGLIPRFSGYGCNMAVRLTPVRNHSIRFDERLPLYSWQEDVDFSRCLAKFGKIVSLNRAQGVHLGVKSGRSTGIRFGYSQVANPLYLSRKRRGYPLRRALSHIAKNIVMNIMRSTWPESYIDRRGRLWGNILAMRDLLSGRMVPERILEL